MAYDYHFIIKQLAEEFKGQIGCLGENKEKYISFSVPIKKEHDNGKEDDSKKEEVANGKEEEDYDDDSKKEDDNSKKKKTSAYKLKFVDSYGFMQSKLSNLVDNLSEI